MAHLVILCGLPGSGKTTLALEIVKRRNAAYFNADDVMQSKRIDLRESKYRARIETGQAVDALTALKEGRDVVIDWGSWSRSERTALREMGQRIGATVELVYMAGDSDLLFHRVTKRELGQPITRAEFDAIVNRFEPPTNDEWKLFNSRPT